MSCDEIDSAMPLTRTSEAGIAEAGEASIAIVATNAKTTKYVFFTIAQ